MHPGGDVGDGVGDGVGEVVGEGVGEVVGDGVGEGVGDRVGEEVAGEPGVIVPIGGAGQGDPMGTHNGLLPGGSLQHL